MAAEADTNQGTHGAGAAQAPDILALTRAVLERLPFNLAVIDHRGVIILVNGAWRQFVDANSVSRPDGFLGALFVDACAALPLLGLAVAQQIVQFTRQPDASATPRYFEYRCPSGPDERWFGIEVAPIALDGRTYAMVFQREVTQRREAERALGESRQRLQAVFDNTLDALFLADDHTSYVDVNPAAAALTGYSREELLTMGIADLTRGNRPAAERIWIDFLGRGVASGELPLTHKDGHLVETEYRAVANIVPGLHLSAVRDITERRRAQAALEASHAQLRRLARRLGDMREQQERSIAYSLSEQLGQSLAALGINLSAVRSRLTREPPELIEQRLATAQRLLDEAFGYLRSVAAGLRPSILDDHGLAATLRWYVAQFSQHSGIIAGVHITEAPALARPPIEVETALFRIAQEALTGIARRGAFEVVVELDLAPDATTLVIRDKRPGRAQRPDDEDAVLDMTGMQERALAMGGALELVNVPGKGTRIVVRVPR